jgi:UMF1 family MFS transporter
MYDWANSAYTMIVTSTILALFFKGITENVLAPETSTAYLGYANSIATAALFIISPILGTMADYKGFKKKFFVFFTLAGVFSTAILAFIPSNLWMWVLIVYVVSAIGFAGANIFYDAFLSDVTSEDRMDAVSSYGYAIGYIGGAIPFILAMAVVIAAAQLENFPIGAYMAMRISFIIAAVWWAAFSIPTIKNVFEKNFIEKEKHFIKKSFARIWDTLKNILKFKRVFIFLLAYFFYIDGVDTIIKMATAYGSDLGLDSTSLLLVLLVTQFVAFPFAILYGKLAKKFSAETMIMIAICVYSVVCLYAFFIRSALDFWITAMLIGSAQGGIQALSRSYFAKIIPKENSSQFFGFYNIFGKFAAIVGPFLMGIVAQITGETRYGVFSLLILFLIGGWIFFKYCFKNRA